MLTVLRALRPFRASNLACQTRLASSDFTVIDDIEEKAVVAEEPKSIATESPIFHERKDFLDKYPPSNPSLPREAWIETLSKTSVDISNEAIRLHPDVWSVRPRLDIIWGNIEWQRWYKRIDWEYVKDRYEMDYTSAKRPWPQKGQGKARHRTKTSPIWIQGGKAHGNKGPRSYFHMKPYHYRVAGLIHTLSAKLAQDDVRFVKDLEIPSDDPKFIEDLIDERGWALSTLFVDKSDEFPKNLTSATMPILHVNMMPAYGLNVHDMVKHKTLVLTKSALEHIEEKLLFAQRRLDISDKTKSAHTEPTAEMPYHSKTGSLS